LQFSQSFAMKSGPNIQGEKSSKSFFNYQIISN